MVNQFDFSFGISQDSKDSMLYLKCTWEEHWVNNISSFRLSNSLLIIRTEHNIINTEMETNNRVEFRFWKPFKHSMPPGAEQKRFDRSWQGLVISEKELPGRIRITKRFLWQYAMFSQIKFQHRINLPSPFRYFFL